LQLQENDVYSKSINRSYCGAAFLLLYDLVCSAAAIAQTDSEPDITIGDNEHVLVTVFLKHNQSINSVGRRELLNESGFFDKFSPGGVEIVGHYVLMGLGQLMILKLPPNLLRQVHVVIGQTAWASYETEFYPTYDLREARRLTQERSENQ